MPTITTAIGTAVYPHLNKPDKKFDKDGPGVYQVSLRLLDEEAAILISLLEEHHTEEYDKTCTEKKKPSLKQHAHPWAQELDDDGNSTGHHLFKFKMKAETKTGIKMRPVLFDAKRQPLNENIGGGTKMKVAFEPSCWFVPSLGFGMTLRLKGVHVIDLVEYSGGLSAEGLGFGEEEGFETASASLASATTTETDGLENADF